MAHSDGLDRSLPRGVNFVVGRKILRALTVVTLVATVSLVVTAQPAAAVSYQSYIVESVNSVKAGTPRAMAVQNALPDYGMPAIQYTYSAAKPWNDIMTLEIEPGNIVRIKPQHTFSPDQYPHNDKCLAIQYNQSGYNRPIVNVDCTYDSVNNDVWYLDAYYLGGFGPAYQLRNMAHGTCIVVQGASTQNNAALVTHNCNGGDNHFWRMTMTSVIYP